MENQNKNAAKSTFPRKSGALAKIRHEIVFALLFLMLSAAVAHCQSGPPNPPDPSDTNDMGGGSYTNYIPDYTPNIVYPTNTTLKWSLPLPYHPVYANLALSPNGILYVPYDEGIDLMALNLNSSSTNFILFNTNYPQGAYTSPVVGADGNIYDNDVDCINPTNGTIIWSTASAGIAGSTLALGPDGSIYLTTDTFVYAITNAYGVTNVYYSTNSFYSGYYGAVVTNIYSYALTNVGLKWAKSTEDYVLQNTNIQRGVELDYSQPAVGLHGDVYINQAGGQIFAVNPTNGNCEWATPINSNASGQCAAPAIGQDGTIYFGCGRLFFSVNPTNGNFNWIYETTNQYEAFAFTPAVSLAGVIYVSTVANPDYDETNRLFAFESTTNMPLWIDNLGLTSTGGNDAGERAGAIALAADGEIYVSDVDEEGTLYSFSPSGATNWVYQTGNGGLNGPIIGPDGSIYVEGFEYSSSYVYAFQGVSPVACGAWPEWRRNARATAAVVQATSSAPVLTASGFQYQINSYSNMPVCDCESSDFHYWTNGGQIVLTNGVGTFVGTGTSNYLYRFYQAFPQ